MKRIPKKCVKVRISPDLQNFIENFAKGKKRSDENMMIYFFPSKLLKNIFSYLLPVA